MNVRHSRRELRELEAGAAQPARRRPSRHRITVAARPLETGWAPAPSFCRRPPQSTPPSSTAPSRSSSSCPATPHPPSTMLFLPSAAALAAFPALAAAYSFTFDNTPTQCGTVSLSVTGAGSPPYSVLIIPFGPSPLPNNTEVRKITQQNFTGNAGQVSFQLKFPTNSQFVAVVSISSYVWHHLLLSVVSGKVCRMSGNRWERGACYARMIKSRGATLGSLPFTTRTTVHSRRAASPSLPLQLQLLRIFTPFPIFT